MANTNAALVKEFHEKLMVEAENCIVRKFPERLFLLKEILSKPEFSYSETDLKFAMDAPSLKLESHVTNYDEKIQETSPLQDSNKLDAFPEQALIPSNKNLIKTINTLDSHIKLFIKDMNTLKLWISLLIPKIESENNFGFIVKQKTCAALELIKNEAFDYFTSISGYFSYRGKLIRQVMKYPLIDDYRQAVEEFDQLQYQSLCIMMHSIFNNYLILNDFFIKNWDTVVMP